MIETIEMQERYPQSRTEDIADSFMRGFESAFHLGLIENAKLRELVRELHTTYVTVLHDLEDMDAASIWEYSDDIDKDLAQSRALYEDLRHKFDDSMRDLGIEVSQ